MEAVGRLAGGIAHDFNNLLTVILGYASTLGGTLGAEDPQHQNVVNIQEAARRAAAITGQLLALSRRQMLRREHVDPNELADKTLTLLDNIIGEHIQVEMRLDPAAGPVWADRSQLEQVLLNLVVNARDAMAQGGTLSVITRIADAADHERCGLGPGEAEFTAVEVRDTSSMRTKSLRIDSWLSSSITRAPVRPPTKPVATTGMPNTLSERAMLMPLPPASVSAWLAR